MDIDKIFKNLGEELKEYGINTFQHHDIPSKTLNSCFGMVNGRYKSCEYGVQCVQYLDYMILVEYNKGDYSKRYTCIVSNGKFPNWKNTEREIFHKATEEQTHAIIEFWNQLIEKRKAEIKEAERNPPIEDFIDMCLEVAKECLKDTEYKARKSKGTVQTLGRGEHNAIVIDDRCCPNPAYAQKGYIIISKTRFGTYCCSAHSSGIVYDYSIKLDNYKEVIKDAVDYIIN